MAGGFTIAGGTSGNLAEVNTDFEINAALSKTVGKAGLAALIAQPHDGASGLAKVQRPVYGSIENRLAVGMDNVFWDDTFTGTNINLSKYQGSVSTMTIAQTGGVVTLNSGASVATTVACQLKSWRTFPIFGNFPTTLDFAWSLALVPQANNVIEIGFGIPAATSPYAPTDGIYMQIDAAGALALAANFNGTVTTSGAITFTFVANRFYHSEIVCHRDRAELWMDGVLVGTVLRSAANTAGALSISQSSHLYARLSNSAATTGAQKINISNWAVTVNDAAANRPWATAMGGLGQNAINLPDGVVAGSAASFANSTAPTSDRKSVV